MDLELKNRIALVTGGSRGIGKAIALSLAREGANLILCAREEEALQKTKAEIIALGVTAHTAVLDATKPDEVKNFFSETIEKIGKLDILINNVGGVTKFGNFENLEADDWQKTLDLNFMSMVYFSQNALPWLKKSDAASVVNVSSVPARQPGLFNPHYSAAKAAVLNTSKYLANNFAKDGIRVNSICPSTIVGENWDERIADRAKRESISEEEARNIMENEEKGKVPLGKLGMPEDVANLVLFLASSKSRFITGVCINVDGGVVRAII